MKAVISNRIYVDYTEDLFLKIKDELTYRIPSKIPGGMPKTIKLFNKIGSVISMPTGCASTIPENFLIKDIRTTSDVVFPDFKFTLREDQQEIYDAVDDSCLINANPSYGKTFIAIALAAKFKQKTLVICHNTLLRDQWVKEVEKTLGFKPDIIGTGKVNYSTPITISNIQTLRKHAVKLSSEFGMIIVDEVHRAPAKIFSDTVNSMKARYKIGLSATLVRKDGMHVVLPHYFSDTVHVASSANQMIPEVHIYKVPVQFKGNSMTPWSIRVNDLYNDPEYYELISGLCQAYAKKGYKVLMVGDRVGFLDQLEEDYDNVIALTGKTKDRENILKQVREGNKEILAGTASIFKEGISENVLSCLILSSLINNEPVLEQLVGRIQRKLDGKPIPIVVDIVPAGDTAKRQGYARAAFYKKQGYKITLVDLT